MNATSIQQVGESNLPDWIEFSERMGNLSDTFVSAITLVLRQLGDYRPEADPPFEVMLSMDPEYPEAKVVGKGWTAWLDDEDIAEIMKMNLIFPAEWSKS